MRRISLFRSLIGTLGVFLVTPVLATFGEVFVSVPSGTAGETLTARVSGITAHEQVEMRLSRPNESEIQFQTQADSLGVITFPIASLHTQAQGGYALEIFRDFSAQPVALAHFSMDASSLSPFRSEIAIESPSIAADGASSSNITVTLKDAFGNAIPGQEVSVFSSRNEDKIVMQKITDTNGKITGKMFSNTPGVGTISAVADGTILFEKPSIVFHVAPEFDTPNVGAGGDFAQYLKASLFETETVARTTEYFTIEELNSELTAKEDLGVTVVAKDAQGNVDPNYAGTIRFSSTDSKAKLPADYTFKPSDQGAHTFYLAISFGTIGQHTLSVHDIDEFRVAGELSVNVLPNPSEDDQSTDTGDGTARVTIDIPTHNSRFSSSRVTVAGSSENCTAVKITDGPTVLVEKLGVGGDGGYTYQTPNLADGYHEFTSHCYPDESAVSNKVGIFIDRSPPRVMAVEISPIGELTPNQEFQIKVGAGEELSGAECNIDGQAINFEAVDSKNFQATSTAPAVPGSYPVSCSIYDLLGNQLQEPNAALVAVAAPNAPDEDGATDPDDQADEEPAIAPSEVSNLKSVPGENKVTLIWSPATDVKGVKNYLVEFADTREALEEPITAAITTNIVPEDGRTQWYVDNLAPCGKYYFQVTAINIDGVRGVSSNIMEASPMCPDQAPITPPRSGADNGKTWPFIIAFLAGFGMLFFLRRKG